MSDIPIELCLCAPDFDWSTDKIPLLLKTTDVHRVINNLNAEITSLRAQVTANLSSFCALCMRLGAGTQSALTAGTATGFNLQFPGELHEDTKALVADFAQALALKLMAAQNKYGYCNDWKSPDWMDECRAKLLEHIGKGDPRDVAAYCAFLWAHNESTAIAATPPDGEAERRDAEWRRAMGK